VPPDARRELLLARADFLLTRGMVEEAEALIDPLTRAGDPGSLAALLYNLGNGRLRRAFDAISDRKIDEASSNVRVAKEHYRRSLAIEPGAFDAKVNLDLAMRLVRDFPEREGAEEEGQAEPKNLWTDLPGLPKGLP
jgi:mxaK protein